MRALLIIMTVLALAACGGSGGSDGPVTSFRDEPTNVYLANIAPRLVDRAHYGIWALPDQRAADARHMPIYHDHDGDGRRLFVGIDQGAGRTAPLGAAGERGGMAIRYGWLNDGAGHRAVADYLAEGVAGRVQRYSIPPEVRVIGVASAAEVNWVIHAVQLVNATLPEGAKMTVGAPLPGLSSQRNTIQVEFVGAREFRGGTNDGIARYLSGQRTHIQFNRDGEALSDWPIPVVPRERDRMGVVVLAHELLHGLGLRSHPRFYPDAPHIMTAVNGGAFTEMNEHLQPHSLLYPTDREAMRVLYSRLSNGDSPTSFGPWDSTSLHLRGEGRHADFGVALRNGYAEPWAYGHMPRTDLVRNGALTDAVKWEGTLLGLTPDAAAVAGEAAIVVDLLELAGTADFTELEAWAPNTAPGAAGTGTQWLDGDLGYSITVAGNTFRETGGDDGTLTGIFVGRAHEGAAGTLERADLTAAFGASR